VSEPVVTNVGPDQQDKAKDIAREHAAKVAGVGVHKPGEQHTYTGLICEVCGVKGQVRVSIVPEREEGS